MVWESLGYFITHMYFWRLGMTYFIFRVPPEPYPFSNAHTVSDTPSHEAWQGASLTSSLRILSNLSRKHVCRMGRPSVTLCPHKVAMELTLTTNFMLLEGFSQKHHIHSCSGSSWRCVSICGNRGWENYKEETRNGTPVGSLDSTPTFSPWPWKYLWSLLK